MARRCRRLYRSFSGWRPILRDAALRTAPQDEVAQGEEQDCCGMPRYRVTVDTGGTFSDFVYLDEAAGAVTIAKVASTPDDPSRAILAGVEGLLAQGVAPDEVAFFCHGTTVGTNALLEGKGARTGLLVTEGFRGIYP